MSRGGGFRGGGRGRGRGGFGGGGGRAGELSMGMLTFGDIAAAARESAKASEVLQYDPNVEVPETSLPDEQERKEAQWGTRLAMGNGVGVPGSLRGGKFWMAIGDEPSGGATKREKGKAKVDAEPWLYSERYKANADSHSSTTTKRLPLLDPYERTLLDKAYFPPELWASYFEGKVDKKRRPAVNGIDGTTDEEGFQTKKRRRADIGEMVDEVEKGGEGKDTNRDMPQDEGEGGEPRDDEEDEEDDPDYDNNYFDNGEDDELGSDGGGDDGGVFD